MNLSRRLAAEALGTGFLLAVVVGSGIMGERLAGGNAALALLANSLATGFGIGVLIHLFAPISGAHFNPLVTLMMAAERKIAWREVMPFVAIQVLAAFAGVAAANLMFGESLFSASEKIRTGAGQWGSEALATFGLMMVVASCARRRSEAAPLAIGAYIAAAYWFCASTSFANPAVTFARAATNTFTGIRPLDVPGFVLSQIVGAAAAIAFSRWLFAEPVSRTQAGESPATGSAGHPRLSAGPG